MILDGRLKHVQTLLGSDLGYGEIPINCVHCAELVGSIAVVWGSDVVIFSPEPLDENQGLNNNEVHVYIDQDFILGGRELAPSRHSFAPPLPLENL